MAWLSSRWLHQGGPVAEQSGWTGCAAFNPSQSRRGGQGARWAGQWRAGAGETVMTRRTEMDAAGVPLHRRRVCHSACATVYQGHESSVDTVIHRNVRIVTCSAVVKLGLVDPAGHTYPASQSPEGWDRPGSEQNIPDGEKRSNVQQVVRLIKVNKRSVGV